LDSIVNNPDEVFMRRALELALLGTGKVSPNPRVGCVLVADGGVIGEGHHQHYGGPHAEANAVNSVANKDLLKEAIVYVTLEPCSHHGKTPPCADLLIHHRVKKVMISTVDSNPLVGGSGIRKLREAGIDVEIGCMEKEGRELNKGFFTFMEKERPFILLKWAQTADGFIARSDFNSKWISNEYSRRLVHRWRSEEDAVMVGTATALHDNPALSVRNWSGRNPVRIVMDRTLRLPPGLQLFDKQQKTFCYNTLRNATEDNLHFIQLSDNNFFDDLLKDLYQRRIQSMMVEGGRQTLDLFINSGRWDEARIFSSAESFGKGIEAPVVRGTLVSREMIFNDSLEIFTNKKDRSE
jgi:diaminohydroxyphosphoribosylaminopyrimidine deaminase/5-amino-6-(5-phosphoribosylamino)uracil reductase